MSEDLRKLVSRRFPGSLSGGDCPCQPPA